MEKINLSEILKDCPKGMELDCTLYENVEFDYIEQSPELAYPIHCITKTNGGYNALVFTHNGCNDRHPNAKCVIFPKGKTTWEGFVPPCKFKDGDIIFTHANCLKVGLGNTWISIYQENRNGGVATYVDMTADGADYYDYIDGGKGLLCMDEDIMRQRLATEEEKAKLFDAIKANGYKWNAETKSLEELRVFKVGDRVRLKSKPNYVYTIHSLTWDDNNKLAYRLLPDNDKHLRVISLIEQNEYELIPNKFDITTLKPFKSEVLVRNSYDGFWQPAFWGIYEAEKAKAHLHRNYLTTKGFFGHCIPYNDDTKHLLGTTNDCDDFYKTWEK